MVTPFIGIMSKRLSGAEYTRVDRPNIYIAERCK